MGNQKVLIVLASLALVLSAVPSLAQEQRPAVSTDDALLALADSSFLLSSTLTAQATADPALSDLAAYSRLLAVSLQSIAQQAGRPDSGGGTIGDLAECYVDCDGDGESDLACGGSTCSATDGEGCKSNKGSATCNPQ